MQRGRASLPHTPVHKPSKRKPLMGHGTGLNISLHADWGKKGAQNDLLVLSRKTTLSP